MSFETIQRVEKIRKWGLSWTQIYNARNKIFTDLKLVVIRYLPSIISPHYSEEVNIFKMVNVRY